MTVSAPTILTASPDDIAFDYEGSTSYSDILHLVGTAAANSTITIYDGATALGTATTNSQGAWTFTTPVLADGAHSFTATATSGGSTSAASPALTETVVASIANFSPLTDQWSSPVSVGGMHYYVENANTNGNAPWAITEVNDHTLQFQVQPGDLWADNASHRSEISGATIFNSNQTVNLSYQFEVQPGFNDTAGNVAWQILGQFHGDDNNQTYLNISGGNPILAFHLTGPNGLGEGDYLAIQGFYALTGQTSFSEATLPGNPLNGYLYVSPTPIVRGQSYNIQLEADFANNSSGFLEVWINGTEVVNYHGPLGYGGGVYWKEGVYEGWSSNQTITVDYSNTVVTTAPGSPLILGNTVNGNEAMLNGTAQANSTVTVYDGATKLGTATTNSSGAWFFETAALSSGSHNLTATATDSAGNVSAASSASNANIVAFTGPIITNVATSAANGETVLGNTITFTLTMSSAVTVTGTPTLSLNDGGTATYKSGTGTNSLTFSYTVGASDTSVTGLAITGANLPGGATIKDGSGNAAILAGAGVQFPGVVIDSQPVQTPVFGAPVANSNGTFTFTGTAGANTTVYFETPYTGGLGSAVVNSSGQWTFTSPTLTYNTWNTLQAYDVNSLGDMSAIGVESGGGFGDNVNLPDSPTITGNALTGSAVTLYGMVSSGESISSVAVYDGATKLGTTTINSDGSWSFTTGTLTNGVHAFTATSTNASGTSGASAADDITIGAAAAPVGPTISSIVESPSSGDLNAGKTVTLTLDMSGNVTVNTTGGTPTLTLNDGTTATYISGSGSSALLFSYTVAAGQNTAALAATAVNLNGATITDGSGNAANLSVTGLTQTGPQIDTTTPTVASVATSGTGITAGSGDLTTGNVVTLTVNLSEAVTVNTTGGTPTLTLNDGGTATYTGGTANALTFSYTVAAGQATADLAVTAVNLNSATVTDGAGNAANLTGAVTNPAGTLQIDTTTPTVASVATSGTGITAGSGDLTTGNVVTLTVNLSEAVTVNTTGGTPTLSLNDGGTATYTGGTGTNALTFSYTVAAGQITADLAVTAVNLNSATIKDGAGNAANLTGAVTNPAGTLQIGTTVPVISSIAVSPSSGDLNAGKIVTYTISLSEAVTVNTTSGRPTLALNDGGTATYVSGTGTNALTFSYTVAAGQNTAALAATALNLNGATIKDGAGNAANLSLTGLTQTGPQIDTSVPAAPIMVSEEIIGNRVVLTGTASVGDIVGIYDGTTLLGTTSSDSTGNWVFETPSETDGAHTFTATATDTAGNVSALSNAIDPDVGAGPVVNAAPVEVGRQYYLYNSSGSDVALTYAGAIVTAGNFGSWTPIAAVQTATGYDVAWKMTGANEYTVWVTNSSGNAISNLTGPVSGTSYALESLESTFNQDLNGDGTIGLTSAVIQVDGSTSLTEVANRFYLDGIGGSGPALQYAGADVTAGEFGGWTPIGAVQTASGYDVAWKMTGANEYTVWTTNSSGNAVGNLTGPVSGTSIALETLESTFNQDLNGDGVIGLYAAPGTTLHIGNPLVGTAATIGTGATLELVGADTGSVTFSSSKGTLVLDQSSTFSGQIYNFTGNGSLSGSDQIDLRDINYNSVQYSYANGVLTVTDGIDTSTLKFNGSYSLANFKFTSDGSGGTIVYDPPVPSFGAGSRTVADSNSPSVTDPVAFGGTVGADTSPGADTLPVDPQKFAVLGSTVGTHTPVADPQNSTGFGASEGTDTESVGLHNSHGYGGSTVIDPPLVSAVNQSNVSGSPSGSDPAGFGNLPASDPPPISPQHPTGFGPLPDPKNGTNCLSMPAFGAATTLGYLADGNTEGTVLATNGAQGPNIALLGNYMASSFPASTGSLAGTTQGADGESIGSSSSLLTHPQHA